VPLDRNDPAIRRMEPEKIHFLEEEGWIVALQGTVFIKKWLDGSQTELSFDQARDRALSHLKAIGPDTGSDTMLVRHKIDNLRRMGAACWNPSCDEILRHGKGVTRHGHSFCSKKCAATDQGGWRGARPRREPETAKT
jgi:hypothetical protein